MRIILRENIEKLGRKGDIVEVAPGYGRNYLIPKKLALEVTASNLKMIEMEQKALRKKFEQEKLSYQEIIDKINQTKLSFFRKAAEKDVIFGSVSATDIRDALNQSGIEVDKKKILMNEPIKRLGNYVVPIKVFHDEQAEVKIEVIKEGEIPAEEKKEAEKEAASEKEQVSVEKLSKEEEDKSRPQEKAK